jgi:enterochelin esterase family protein
MRLSEGMRPMPEVMITWRDPDTVRPAHDVVVRLVALTDNAYESGDIGPYLMRPRPDRTWVWRADLPSDLRTSYQICPVRDRPVRGEPIDEQRWAAIVAAGRSDPSCADSLPAGCTYGNPDEPASVLSMPGALRQPWVERRAAVRRGSLVRMPLTAGSLVHVYRSAGPSIPDPPLLVIFDGQPLLTTDVTATFDNLAADGVLESLTAVVIESIRGSAPRGPSRVDSLTRGPELESFVFDELLPAVEATYPVTREPAGRVLVGHSLGALAALHLAARRPDQFGAVVAGSAALWWPGGDGQLAGPDVAAAYVDTGRPGRLFVDVGTEEGDLLRCNRDFRDALVRAGRDVTYREFRGGHDHACWRGGLADGIVDVLSRPSG